MGNPLPINAGDTAWVLVSAATGFGWELVVTDELAGVTKTFSHPLDGHASGVADFSAFTTCAVPTPTPSPTPEPVVTPTPVPTPRPTPPYALVRFQSLAICDHTDASNAILEDPNHYGVGAWNSTYSGAGASLEVTESTVGPFLMYPTWSLPCGGTRFDAVFPVEYGWRYELQVKGDLLGPTGGTIALLRLEPIYGEVASAFLSSEAALHKRIARAKKVLAGSERLFDLGDADIGLTPHCVHPIPRDGLRPTEADLAVAGVRRLDGGGDRVDVVGGRGPGDDGAEFPGPFDEPGEEVVRPGLALGRHDLVEGVEPLPGLTGIAVGQLVGRDEHPLGPIEHIAELDEIFGF